MSIQLIQQYYSSVERLIRYGGTRNESSLRKSFQELLDYYARSKNLVLVPEVGVMGKKGRTVHPDGTLKDALRQDWGYWESKDIARRSFWLAVLSIFVSIVAIIFAWIK